jgi:predicted PilT family ATPase
MESKLDRREDFNQITQSLPIPEYKMGWIIGKKGTYINQLAKKSGAAITISDSKSKEYGTVWKYVQITGTGRAVDRAKKLLHIRLERLEPRDVTSCEPDSNVNESVELIDDTGG